MKVTTDSCLFGAWVAEEVEKFKVQRSNLLEVGCGTGLLSLMIAQKADVLIDAIEINKEAAQQANENVLASPWSEKITIINEDVLQLQTGKKWDCIISNPPFYESDLKSGKHAKDIAHHNEGLKLADLLLFIKDHLNEDGIFFLLLPAKREAELDKLFDQYRFHFHIKVLARQTPEHPPFRIMIKASQLKIRSTERSEIIIKEDQQYSSAFTALLKDYYLYL